MPTGPILRKKPLQESHSFAFLLDRVDLIAGFELELQREVGLSPGTSQKR